MSWLVLMLLIAGLTFGVAGPVALVYGKPAARTAIRNSVRRIGKIRIRRKNAS
jgi:hypothetical protein